MEKKTMTDVATARGQSSYIYYNPQTTVKKSEPPAFASTGYPPFLDASTLPKRKPFTAGWIDTLDMSLLSHRPYRYNPHQVNLEPVFSNAKDWPKFHRLRQEL